MTKSDKVFETLDLLSIPYEVTFHPAVFTIDEMDQLQLNVAGEVCKNLFLRDDKGRSHFLVVLQKDKKADLKDIRQQLGCSGLSFASEERLKNYLGLNKGEVSPLGVLNDKDCVVTVVFDKALIECSKLGVHPNDNTATIWISFADLQKVIAWHGNPMCLLDI